jgi:hypothetical protein
VTTSRRLRSVRRRAALVVAVWALSSVWAVGHAVAHERDHDEHHAAAVAEGPVVSMGANHDHGHSHPVSSPVVSSGKSPDRGSLALLAAAPDRPYQAPLLRGRTGTGRARVSPPDASASGARAPPVS